MGLEELNTWANLIFERCKEVNRDEDPKIEAAIQALSDAADRLSALTYDDGGDWTDGLETRESW